MVASCPPGMKFTHPFLVVTLSHVTSTTLIRYLQVCWSACEKNLGTFENKLKLIVPFGKHGWLEYPPSGWGYASPKVLKAESGVVQVGSKVSLINADVKG